MLHFALLVAFSGLASAAPGYGGYATNNHAEAHSGYSYGIHNTKYAIFLFLYECNVSDLKHNLQLPH